MNSLRDVLTVLYLYWRNDPLPTPPQTPPRARVRPNTRGNLQTLGPHNTVDLFQRLERVRWERAVASSYGEELI